MAGSNPKALLLLALILSAPQVPGAVPSGTQLPITLDAQSVEGGLGAGSKIFRKVKIVQGGMSIAADLGQASSLDFDDSVWVFRGNVKIAMDQGLLSSDDAEITFRNKQLRTAVVNGKPASFEQQVQRTGKLAQGRSDLIEYNAASGIVHLSKNAWVSDGQNEIRGESLKYNIIAQSIVAESSEQAAQRVHIVITPPPAKP